MNTTDLQTKLEEFVTWFLTIEEIPLEERQRFVDHLLEVGTFDEKSFQFIEYTLNDLCKNSQKRADVLKRRLEAIASAIAAEQIPEISLKENIVKNAEIDMQNMVQKFETDYKRWDKSKTIQEETTQTTAEADEIAHLKELVGA